MATDQEDNEEEEEEDQEGFTGLLGACCLLVTCLLVHRLFL